MLVELGPGSSNGGLGVTGRAPMVLLEDGIPGEEGAVGQKKEQMRSLSCSSYTSCCLLRS